MKIKRWTTVSKLSVAVFALALLFGKSGIAQEADMQSATQQILGKDVTERYQMLNSMSLEEKVAQMFFLTPEALTGASPVSEAGELTKQRYAQYPVGGIIYFSENLISREQVTGMLENMQRISMERTELPIFLAVDEEGGMVSRLYGGWISDIPYIGDMYTVGSTGDSQKAYDTCRTIGTYLKELNFNVDFAPVADVFSNPENTVIGNRAFGSTADLVSSMIPMAVKGLQDAGVQATLKHFPGHGDTAEDSHSGYASSYKTLQELEQCELLPFAAGIQQNAAFVMVGHISFPNILGSQLPASLSKEMVSGILRKKLGFNGIVITDALNMGAIAANYTSGEAAVLAVEAGVDMLLMPGDFMSAYEAVLEAVQEGRISEARIDESVRRIVELKLEMKKNIEE